MRPIVIVLVVVALGIAGITAVLVSRFVADQQVQSQAIPMQIGPPTEEVLVASVDIKAGALVKSEDLRYESWPTSAMDARFIRRGAGEDPKSAFIGTIARRPLLAGEPLSSQVVFRQDEAGVMAGLLSPGMRAVSLALTPTAGVAGFIQPNDHVDVFLNQDVKAMEMNGQELHGDFQRLVTQVVLSDVRVLAIDEKLVRPDSSANLQGKDVTLEVSPKDAEILLTAVKMGEITLALRSLSPGEAGDAPSSGFTSDLEISRAFQSAVGGAMRGRSDLGKAAPRASGGTAEIRVNRAGSTTTQSFSN